MHKHYLKPILLLFFFFAGAGAIEPALSMILYEKELPIETIGFLTLLPRAMTLLAAPLWALLADRFHLQRHVLAITMGLSIPFLLTLNLQLPYVLLLIMILLFSINYSPVRALCDAAAVGILGDNDHHYGTIRALGAIGYAMAVLLVGQFASNTDTSIATWLFALFFGIGLIIALLIPSAPKIHTIPITEVLRMVVKDQRWLGLLSGALFAGFGTTAITNYFMLFLKEVHANTTQISIALSSASLGAMVLFLLTPFLLKKVSAHTLIQFSFLALALRLFLYTQTSSPMMIALIQLMHGLSFAIFWSVGVVIAHRISPVGFANSGQAVFSGFYFGLGGMSGAYFGGLIYSQFSINIMFWVAAVVSLIGLLTYTILMKGSSKRHV